MLPITLFAWITTGPESYDADPCNDPFAHQFVFAAQGIVFEALIVLPIITILAGLNVIALILAISNKASIIKRIFLSVTTAISLFALCVAGFVALIDPFIVSRPVECYTPVPIVIPLLLLGLSLFVAIIAVVVGIKLFKKAKNGQKLHDMISKRSSNTSSFTR